MKDQKKDTAFEWNETIQKLIKDDAETKSSISEISEISETVVGCECCIGDEALYWKDNENNAFVDSKGDVLVTVKDHMMRFKVKCCPNCGRKFEKHEEDKWQEKN